MRRILIVRFSSLGDMVLLASLVAAAQRKWPEAELSLATKDIWAPLYQSDPRLAQVLSPGDEGIRAFAGRLRQMDFDLILDAHASLRSRHLAALLTPVPLRRIGKDTLARLAYLKLRHPAAALQRRLVDRYAAMVDEEVAERPRIFPGEAEPLIAAGDWLAVVPGARHPTKRWPLESFAEVAEEMRELAGARLLVIAGPGEEAAGDALATRIQPDAFLRGPQELPALAATLERCRVLVGNDSGLAHLAEAVGTPVVSIFGPTVREWGYFPLDPRSHALEPGPLECRPCSRSGEKPCRLAQRICLLQTTPAMTLAAVKDTWSCAL